MLVGKYKVGSVLGEGSTSVVRMGYHLFTQEAVAVKCIAKDRMWTEDLQERVAREADVLKRFDYPGVVKLHEFLEDEYFYYIITEYCGGGELFDFIISRRRVEEPLAKRFFKQIAMSVHYCHRNNVCHRDIKPENLLLTSNTTVKLIDFGLCSVDGDSWLCDKCGSECYLAPEVLSGAPYRGYPADIWALGVVLYALVIGTVPWDYNDPSEMRRQILTGDYGLTDDISDECRDLIVHMLEIDPERRITTEEVLTHPWLFGIGNVFPLAKVSKTPSFNGLQINASGFSSSDLRQKISGIDKPSLETIYEDRPQSLTVTKAQPRSVSLAIATASTHMEEEADTNSHRGVIFSKTISQKDPSVVAMSFELDLVKLGIQYTKVSPHIFQLRTSVLVVEAEICRLTGFRNVYVISFKRVQGESWPYSQFVSELLERL